MRIVMAKIMEFIGKIKGKYEIFGTARHEGQVYFFPFGNEKFDSPHLQSNPSSDVRTGSKIKLGEWYLVISEKELLKFVDRLEKL